MEQITAFKKDYKKNNTRNKKAFELFINQNKDFCDDVFSVIKSFMIEPIYKNSYKFIEQRELRYNHSCVDPTTFFIGKRYKNLIQVKLIRNDENVLIENPEFKFYKIKTKELKNITDETDIILLEFIDIKYGYDENAYDGKCEIVYYMVAADMYDIPLWTVKDDLIYKNKMDEINERDMADYYDFMTDIQEMLE